MKNPRKLGATFVVILVLAASALTSQISVLACPLPEPGQLETPPCTATQQDYPPLGDTLTPPASSTTDLSVLAEAAMNLLTLY